MSLPSLIRLVRIFGFYGMIEMSRYTLRRQKIVPLYLIVSDRICSRLYLASFARNNFARNIARSSDRAEGGAIARASRVA